jgi:hypothetical protein
MQSKIGMNIRQSNNILHTLCVSVHHKIIWMIRRVPIRGSRVFLVEIASWQLSWYQYRQVIVFLPRGLSTVQWGLYQRDLKIFRVGILCLNFVFGFHLWCSS